MKLRFKTNSSRQWLVRTQVAFVLSIIIGIALITVASMGSRESWWTGLVQSPLSAALNLLIVAAAVAGAVIMVFWLIRASREEALINRFFEARGEQMLNHGPAALADINLSSIPTSALSERIEILSAGIRNNTRIDPATLADALADREQSRVAIARYFASSLVLIGLLGTFIGLVITVGGVTQVVSALEIGQDSDMSQFLVQLKEGIRRPLDGMGLAFSTSLFGLAGSMVLGIGALGLSSAQAAWTGKLEEITALCTPTPEMNALSNLMWEEGAMGEEVLQQLLSAGHYFQGLQKNAQDQLLRTADTTERASQMVDALRNEIAGMTGPLQRMDQRHADMVALLAASNESSRAAAIHLQQLSEQAGLTRQELRESNERSRQEVHDALHRLEGGVRSQMARGQGPGSLG